MNSLSAILAGLALACSAACGSMATLAPTGIPPTIAPTASPSAASPSGSVSQLITGTAGPMDEGTPPCFADRYPCAVYAFSLLREGPIEVDVAWEGSPRALMVQLYWAGEGLAHEDVAPRNGPSRIHFRRPRMEAVTYTLRVVNLEPTRAIPFTLTLTH